MPKAYLMVRAVVEVPMRQKFDRWYGDHHLPMARAAFKAEKAWRFWSAAEAGVHYAVYRFANRTRLDAALKAPSFKELVADFDQAWPRGATRTRDILDGRAARRALGQQKRMEKIEAPAIVKRTRDLLKDRKARPVSKQQTLKKTEAPPPPGPTFAGVQIDLHGYRPRDVRGAPLASLLEQAWQMGAPRIRFIHGHGRARGKSPGPYNTNTGSLGLSIRRQLRRYRELRQWIKYSTLDCSEWGRTTVKLKRNPRRTRTALDLSVLPPRPQPQ
jgi:DNA-nicking Smr family endonuclease